MLRWASGYPRAYLRGDVIAGLTVAVMLVPQAMAYANLAGLPPVTGLYAAVVAIAVYAVLGTSGTLAVGPVAIASLLTLSGLQGIVEPEDPDYVAAATLLALLVGGILLLAGALRLGFLVDFLAHPVISGFTSAAALTIAVSQLKDILGVKIARPDGVLDTLNAIGAELDAVHGMTLAVGLATIVVLAVGRRVAPLFPSALVVMIIAVLVSWAGDLQGRGVAVLGDVPTGLPRPAVPDASRELVMELIPVALTIAVVAYAEGISIAKALARRRREKVGANQELIAVGGANAAAGLFGGFPVAGSFSRTAVNFSSGARTPLAGLITGVVLVIAVLFLTPALYHLPKAVLAGVVIVAAATLIDVGEARRCWRSRRSDFAALIVTFAATLLIGVEPGLAIGVGFSLAQFVYRASVPHITELGRVQGSTEYRNVDRWVTVTSPTIALVRVDGSLVFASVRSLEDRIGALVSGRAGLRAVILDASAINDIDGSGAHLLADLDLDLAASGIELRIATVRGPVRDVLHRGGEWDRFAARVHPSLAPAIAAVEPDSILLVAGQDESEVPVL